MPTLYDLGLRIRSEGFAEAMRGLRQLGDTGKQTAANLQGLTAAFVKGGLIERGISNVARTVVEQLGQAITEAGDAERVMNELGSAVDNVGGNFHLLAPTLNDAAEKMAKFSRFSDDTARVALTRMIMITGDTKGALDNLGLAADVAAGSHRNLEDAAELVGKAMAGNTKGLKEFGINTKDSAVALDELRSKFRGFAEKDGASLQGRLEQIKNAWGEVLEAFGKAVTGSTSVPEALNKIVIKLTELAGWIDGHAGAWQAWATNAIKWVSEVEARMAKVERIAHAIYRFTHPGQVEQTAFNDVASGASNSSQPGPLFQDVTSGNAGHSTPGARTGGGGGKGSGVKIPNIDLSSTNEATLGRLAEKLGKAPEISISGVNMDAKPVPGIGMSVDQLKELYKNYWKGVEERSDEVLKQEQKQAEKAAAAMAQVSDIITQGMAQTLGDAIYNAFTAAFNGEGLGGIFKAFGKTVLAGLGQVFTQLGMVYLEYGGIMQALSALLPNPFTAGPAGLAIGAALIAMGSALGAVAKGGAGRGTAAAGAFRERGGSTGEIIRLKFVDRPGYGQSMVPASPVVINAYGPNDPKTQRWMLETFNKATRRNG